eukprot:TRINITY_DN2905_c0_g1_i1.p1 TRINITY_DN2905_c0_g1~~TRINITY_DN2905_c0_g1_i1.p1  ORF type:complete len:109 (-),score=20.87 TRINITY_DN2905_c0_g1_i1:541-867(-)
MDGLEAVELKPLPSSNKRGVEDGEEGSFTDPDFDDVPIDFLLEDDATRRRSCVGRMFANMMAVFRSARFDPASLRQTTKLDKERMKNVFWLRISILLNSFLLLVKKPT